jgi:acetyl-CoA synthetase
VFDWEPPTFRWFVGGETNLARNCLDANLEAGRGDRTALVAVDERGRRRSFTYRELLSEVERAAAGLRAASATASCLRIAVSTSIVPSRCAAILITSSARPVNQT